MSRRMNKIPGVKTRRLTKRLGLRALSLSVPAAGGLLLAGAPAQAMQLYDGTISGNNNWEVSLDTTVSYTGMYRVGHASAVGISGAADANSNDGDANFRSGLVSNLFEVLPVLDIKNQGFGMHFSGEYFINTVYLGNNKNNQGFDYLNTIPDPEDSSHSFSKATATAEGHNGKMLDAFIYNSWRFGREQELTIKAGKQTLFWGQSLFSSNGISGGQAPVDVISAQNIVNAQSQQIFLPVGQVVVTYKPDLTYTLQAYYQFEWEPTELQASGSFFSTSDMLGPGGYYLLLPNPYTGGYIKAGQVKAVTPPSQNGQFGVSVQARYGNYDVGIFGLRYDAKGPQLYVGVNSSYTPYYRLIYPRDIWIGGTSVGTTIGATTVAGELSVRTHAPLVTEEVTSTNANSDPGYAVGDVMTGLLNAIYISPSLSFDPGGVTVLGELQYVDVLSSANKVSLAPGRSNGAASFNGTISPAYNEVLPFLDVSFPVGFSYNFAGNSRYDTTMNHGTGTFNIGVSATYRTVWTASLTFVTSYGKFSTNELIPETQGAGGDRKYIQLNIQRTF